MHWLSTLSLHNWFDIIAYAVATASVLYTVLPPWEQFAKWPNFQSRYQFFLIFLKAIAINGRTAMSKVYGNDISSTSQQSSAPEKQAQ